jgi:2-hydroxychromene-2-carboxylate isomerase
LDLTDAVVLQAAFGVRFRRIRRLVPAARPARSASGTRIAPVTAIVRVVWLDGWAICAPEVGVRVVAALAITGVNTNATIASAISQRVPRLKVVVPT